MNKRESKEQTKPALLAELAFYPVTAESWQDLQTLFGEHGAYGNCWCMWWRLSRSDFGKQTGQEKKQGKTLPPASNFTGVVSAFSQAGFIEVERRSERRQIMRHFFE